MERPDTLLLVQYDDIYVVDLSQTTHFMADDHYTHVHYATGQDFLVPFGLLKIESMLQEKFVGRHNPFMRLGRKYIVNLDRIFHLNTIKQELTLVSDVGQNSVLHIPKPVLRNLYELFSRK